MTLPTPLFPLGFTAITDHLGAGEVPPGCGLQSSAAPVNFPVSFRSWAAQSAGDSGFSVAATLSLFLSGQLVSYHSGQILKP
jgi:hypothetical protein